ncbi:MAG TPA: SRPBCC family protein [Rubricoccaceae bacterium]|jgi:ligand-binding SRPBCC domain-containing protein
MARLHTLQTSMTLARPRAEVFAFFAAAENLERITPPELKFSIVEAPPSGIRQGAIIRYRLRLAGVPFGWTTEISRWQPDRLFVDEQRRGPYAVWHHTHRFADVQMPDGTTGTRIDDTVLWALPLVPLGEIAAPIVAWQVARIFAHRERAIRAIFDAR